MMTTTPDIVFLRAWRLVKGLTQDQLAEHIGVHKGTISRWESGERNMDTDDLVKVANALQIEPLALFRSPDDHDQARAIDRFAKLVTRIGVERANRLLDALDDGN